MSPVDVANAAPVAVVPTLCNASRRRYAVASNCMRGTASGPDVIRQPANNGSGRPGTSTAIAKIPPEWGSRESSPASRICRALVT